MIIRQQNWQGAAAAGVNVEREAVTPTSAATEVTLNLFISPFSSICSVYDRATMGGTSCSSRDRLMSIKPADMNKFSDAFTIR